MSNPSSSADGLRVEVEHRDRAAIVKLTGSANMDVADDLQERLLELVDTPTDQLILDLSELQFVSSVGLGAIIAAHLRCRHHDGEIRLVAPPPKILELLEVTKLTKLFAIYDSVEAAIAAG